VEREVLALQKKNRPARGHEFCNRLDVAPTENGMNENSPSKAEPEILNRKERPRRKEPEEVVPEDHGFAFAEYTGDTEPVREHEEALRAWAEAIARTGWDGRWDPQTKPADAMLAREQDERLKKRPDFDKFIRQRDAEYREAAAILASTPAAGPKPATHWVLQGVAIAAITISLAPTLRDDFFVSIENSAFGWLAALAASTALAALVVGSALWNISVEAGQ
jgi:hypothetical protein